MQYLKSNDFNFQRYTFFRIYPTILNNLTFRSFICEYNPPSFLHSFFAMAKEKRRKCRPADSKSIENLNQKSFNHIMKIFR